MGGFLGPKYSKQGSFSADFPKTCFGFAVIGKKLSKMSSFLPKFIITVSVTATVDN